MDYHGAKAYILDKLRRELSETISSHGIHHTLAVWGVTEELCHLERIPPYETMLLKTAALFHDSGFIVGHKNHEAIGCEIAKTALPRYSYSGDEIGRICGMIMATKIPQSPHNFLEKILCDADLDYLGRNDFYPIGCTLFEELKAYNFLETEEAWNRAQVSFLEAHSFFTGSNRERRSPKKQHHLTELKELISKY